MPTIETIKEKLSTLTESEAKSFLLLIYAGLDTAVNGSGGEQYKLEYIDYLYQKFHEMPKDLIHND